MKKTSLILAGIMGSLSMASVTLGGDCIETGPHLQPTWYLDGCPTLNNTPSVSPANECVGTMPPNITLPIYSPGSKHQISNYNCKTNVDIGAPVNITWTAGSVYWLPVAPNPVTDDYSQTAYVDITSSDPSLCAGPTQVNVGSCLFHVNQGPCTLTAPNPDPNVTIKAAGSDSGTAYVYLPTGTGYIEYDYDGAVSAIQANYTYVADRQGQVSSCGPSTPLPNNESLPGYEFSADIGLPLGDVADIGFGVDWHGAEQSWPIYSTCVSPPANYTRQYGSTWFRKGTPIAPTFTGSVTSTPFTRLPLGGYGQGQSTTTNYRNQAACFVNASESYFEDAIASACCVVKCCPNN